MKRLICLLLAIMLLIGCVAVDAFAENGLEDVYCSEKDFSTKCDPDYITEWEEGNGLRIWLDGKGYVPNILIWRRSIDKKFSDPVNYLNNVYREYMEEKYNNAVTTDQCRTVKIGDKTVYFARYHYIANGNKLVMARIIEVRDDGDVEYAAKHSEDEPDEAMEALEMAVKYYNTGKPAAGKQTAGKATEKPAAGKKTTGKGTALNVTKAKPIISGTSQYKDGRIHMYLPNGWQILTQSDYMTFCFKAWDPSSPNRTIFLFMKMEPFLKGQAALKWYKNKAGSTQDSVYRIYSEAPVMDSCTIDALLKSIPQIRDYCDLFYASGLTVSSSVLPQMTDVEILEKTPSKLPAPSDCKENVIARISYKDYLGAPCEGLVTAQPRNPAQYYLDGVDTLPYVVNLFMGVTAPAGELEEIEPVLTECLGSFGFESSYVQKAINLSNDQTQQLKEQLRQIEAAHDALMEAWYAREQAHDIAFQKLSDSIMGYDRLYDSSTGEIYRVDVGFYDSYNLNRYEYSNSNLQLIDSSSQQYYLQGVDYYITK
ncbi:MAG: hypothetical protein IK133_06115 [Clostridia bacterium]|nr:hypothetical protein [Clostridia bacterium]